MSSKAEIKEALIRADAVMPGAKAKAERVAVYAVAIADRAGFGSEDLLVVRRMAELRGLPEAEASESEQITQIVELASQFVDHGPDWLQSEARAGLSPRFVDALDVVRLVISPADV